MKPLTDLLTVAPQIMPEDVAGLTRAGFALIICNRPDGEAPDQPAFAEIEAAAQAAGLAAAYIPVRPGAPMEEAAAAFAAALEGASGPVLAYCRSGARSTLLAERAGAL